MKRSDIMTRVLVFSVFVCLLHMPGFSFPKALYAAENPDGLYADGKYKEAEQAYRKLDMDRPDDLKFRYNRGCAAFQSGSFDAARAAFTSVMRRSSDNDMRFRGLYNLGSTSYKQNDFAAARDFYKQALSLRPGDSDARHNLELALKALKKQQEVSKDPKQEDGSEKESGEKQGDKSQDNKDRNSEGKDQDTKQGQGESKQPDKPGNKGDEKQDQPPGQKPDQGQGTQAGQQDKPGEEKQDLSGELKGQNMGKASGAQAAGREGNSAAIMERKKAEALLNNINENRGRMNRLQGAQGGRGVVGSGKEW